MEVLYRATNIIERDSMMSFLRDNDIEVFTGRRDVIQNLTDNPNLSYEGYSALFTGYEIFVESKDFDRAKELVEDYRRQINLRAVGEDDEAFAKQKHFERRLMVSAMLSLFLPLIAHLLFLYLLKTAFANGISFSRWFYIRAAIIMLSTGILGTALVFEGMG